MIISKERLMINELGELGVFQEMNQWLTDLRPLRHLQLLVLKHLLFIPSTA